MAGQLDFINECQGGVGICEIGATFGRVLTWKIDCDLVDLTSASAQMQIRKNLNSPIIIELNTTNHRILLGGAAGTIELRLTPEETKTIPPGDYIYDLFIFMGTEVERLVEGKFHVAASVTHD